MQITVTIPYCYNNHRVTILLWKTPWLLWQQLDIKRMNVWLLKPLDSFVFPKWKNVWIISTLHADTSVHGYVLGQFFTLTSWSTKANFILRSQDFIKTIRTSFKKLELRIITTWYTSFGKVFHNILLKTHNFSCSCCWQRCFSSYFYFPPPLNLCR